MEFPEPADDGQPAIQHYVVLCRDAECSAAVRATALAAHRAHVDNWAASIVLSGPLVDDDGEQRIGQFYVLGVESRTDAEEFVGGDPFTQAAVFTSVEVTRLLPRFLHGIRALTPGPDPKGESCP